MFLRSRFHYPDSSFDFYFSVLNFFEADPKTCYIYLFLICQSFKSCFFSSHIYHILTIKWTFFENFWPKTFHSEYYFSNICSFVMFFWFVATSALSGGPADLILRTFHLWLQRESILSCISAFNFLVFPKAYFPCKLASIEAALVEVRYCCL